MTRRVCCGAFFAKALPKCQCFLFACAECAKSEPSVGIGLKLNRRARSYAKQSVALKVMSDFVSEYPIDLPFCFGIVGQFAYPFWIYNDEPLISMNDCGGFPDIIGFNNLEIWLKPGYRQNFTGMFPYL